MKVNGTDYLSNLTPSLKQLNNREHAFVAFGDEYTALMTQNRAIAHVTARYPPLYCRYRIKRFNLITRALIGRWQTRKNNFLLIAPARDRKLHFYGSQSALEFASSAPQSSTRKRLLSKKKKRID